MVLCKQRLSHAAFTHAIMARLIASKAGSQPAIARRADTDRPESDPIVRAVDRLKSLMAVNLGMATAEPYKAAGCRPVRKIWAPSRLPRRTARFLLIASAAHLDSCLGSSRVRPPGLK